LKILKRNEPKLTRGRKFGASCLVLATLRNSQSKSGGILTYFFLKIWQLLWIFVFPKKPFVELTLDSLTKTKHYYRVYYSSTELGICGPVGR
jgi:hypothetical protein